MCIMIVLVCITMILADGQGSTSGVWSVVCMVAFVLVLLLTVSFYYKYDRDLKRAMRQARYSIPFDKLEEGKSVDPAFATESGTPRRIGKDDSEFESI